jgi:hypothetical protein
MDIKEIVEGVLTRIMTEALVRGIFEGYSHEFHPRGKDGKFTAKGRAELKYAHGDFLLKTLARRADKIQNGNTKRSAVAALGKLTAHSDAMVKAIHHPEVSDDGNPTYAQVHRSHGELMKGVREFNASFKGQLGEES